MADAVKRLGVVSGLLGATVLAIEVLGSFFASRSTSASFVEELGTLTQGDLALVVLHATTALQFVVGVFGVAALGYRAGQRIDLDEEYRRLLLVVGGAGIAGYGPGFLLFSTVDTSGPLLYPVAVGVGSTVALGIRFALAGFAGAALAHVTDGDAVVETITEFERYHLHGD